MEFRNELGERVFRFKYAAGKGNDYSWAKLASDLVEDVCGSLQGTSEPILSKTERDTLEKYIREFKWIPGGRYLYYAGRPVHFWNNCFLLKGEEDTREEWARIVEKSTSCLMSGGGIGIDYSVFRGKGSLLSRTGGEASGPLSLMKMVNEVGRYVMQGGSRRSAIYASLNWQHSDAEDFLRVKDWHSMPIGNQQFTYWDAKQEDFNFPAPLDMTNVSLNYDDAFLNHEGLSSLFIQNVRQAMQTGEPGFSFNFGEKQDETLRNA